MNTTWGKKYLVTAAAACGLVAGLAGCSSGTVAPEQTPGPDNPTEGVVDLNRSGPQQDPSGEPENEVPQAKPTEEADCPYLSTEEAEEATGEKVTRVDIDPGFEPAACFFTTIDGSISLVTTMHHFESEDRARELVDDAAPPDTTERSDIDGGWTGGKSSGAFGALLAVYRGSDVFVVQSTQERSMAVQRVAEMVIPRIAG